MTRLVRFADLRPVPWRNGGGETREIAVHPTGAGYADFVWRISMATVASDGPFSIFPGIDRTLAVLSGDGLRLTVDGAPDIILTRDTPPHAFPADAPASARLIGTSVLDLNVMTRREVARHRMTCWHQGMKTVDKAAVIALVCAAGVVEAGDTELQPGDVAFVSAEALPRARAHAEGGRALVVELWMI